MKSDVTVIVPCYRCSETIARAVGSVVAQTQKPMAIVLVNDCSDDDTMEVLSSIKEQYSSENIIIIDLPCNVGPGEARNAGWEISQTKYIAFLDSDDTWLPTKLEIQTKLMDEHPGLSITAHKISQTYSEPVQAERKLSNVSYVSFNKLIWSNKFPTSSVILRREVSHRFLPKQRYIEDYSLWLRITKENMGGFIDKVLGIRYKRPYGDFGLSSNLWKMQKGELQTYKILHDTGLLSAPLFLAASLFSLAKFMRRLVYAVTIFPVKSNKN